MPISPIERTSPPWRSPLPAADLFTTGAGGAVPVRPVQAANPVESTDRLGEGSTLREPTRASDPDKAHRDWTLAETEKEKPKEVEEIPPQPPLYQQMLDFIQSLWRASGSAIDVAQEVNKNTLTERLGQQAKNEELLTYSDLRVKRSGKS